MGTKMHIKYRYAVHSSIHWDSILSSANAIFGNNFDRLMKDSPYGWIH